MGSPVIEKDNGYRPRIITAARDAIQAAMRHIGALHTGMQSLAAVCVPDFHFLDQT